MVYFQFQKESYMNLFQTINSLKAVTGCSDKAELAIASKQLNLHLDKENEAIYLEINIRVEKRFIVGL